MRRLDLSTPDTGDTELEYPGNGATLEVDKKDGLLGPRQGHPRNEHWPPRKTHPFFRVLIATAAHAATVDLSPYQTFITDLAIESGALLKPLFGQPGLVVELKGDLSPVTAADRGAEEILRRRIAARYPSHGIIGEELGQDRPDAEFVWVLDPVDGTKAFITGIPLWGTLIALLHHGQPILGCIHQPVLGQLVIGNGTVTTANGRTVHCRRTRKIEEATLLTSDPFNPGRYQDGVAFEALARRARLVRTWGDCYGYLLLATGWADIALDPIMNPWDIAALIPVIRGAGGVISDWQGNRAYPAESTVACATPELHAGVISALAGH